MRYRVRGTGFSVPGTQLLMAVVLRVSQSRSHFLLSLIRIRYEPSVSKSEHDPSASDSAPPGIPPESPPANPAQPPEGAQGLDDGFSEYEPLTPELVEEEALRGDFVLKWAVVLLAFLLGSSRIADSSTLVNLKTGQYLAAHGMLPPANDVFSYTAADRPWINLSWGFDLLAAGVYAVGGWAGLSLFKALLAAIMFALIVRISRPGLPTWWGAVCSALALLACHTHLNLQPALATLLGTALTLWLLYGWQTQQHGSRRLWLLVPVFVCWGNLDPRMYLGLGLLLLFGLGDLLGAVAGRGASLQPEMRRQFWMVFAACGCASLLHPFGWRALFSPALIYGGEYQAFRSYLEGISFGPGLQYFPMTYAPLWSASNFDVSFLAGLLLGAVALVSMALNWSRLEFSHVALYLGFLAFALLALHELAVAAIVCSVLAVLNGQAWYAARFRQNYSVETGELLFSRGGRALTVLAFAAVAFLAGTGRLRGAQAPRTGFGIDYNLGATIDSLRELLADSFDDRPFNFLPTQGDVLIWLDQRVFVDSRWSLYYGQGEHDLLKQHSALQVALRKRRPNVSGSGDPKLWKKTFDELNVTHIMPRLTGSNPDYVTLLDLLDSNQDWQLTRLGAASAVFYRVESPSSAAVNSGKTSATGGGNRDAGNPQPDASVPYQKFLAAHRLSFLDEAFKKPGTLPAARMEWVRSPTFYQKYFWAHRREIPNSVQEAMHLVVLANETQALPGWLNDSRAALAILGIRKAQEGLGAAPNCTEGYHALAQGYWLLARWDAAILQNPALQREGLRYFQAVASINQALVADPAAFGAHIAAFQLYEAAGKPDLALQELEIILEMQSRAGNAPGQQIVNQENTKKMIEQLNKVTAALDDELLIVTQRGGGALQLAQHAYQRGFVRKALQHLERNQETMEPSLDAKRLKVVLLMECGRAEDAYIEAGLLEELARRGGVQNWAELCAITSLANSDYARAIQFWSSEADQIEQSGLARLVLSALPRGGSVQPPWPVGQTAAAFEYLFQRPSQVGFLRQQVALVEMEGGERQKAIRNFRDLLRTNPETPARPLAVHYMKQLTGEEIDPLPPSERIPVLFEPEPHSS